MHRLLLMFLACGLWSLSFSQSQWPPVKGCGAKCTVLGENRSKGLRTQTQNAAFFERKGLERKPWPRGKSINRKNDRNAFFER